MQTYPLLSTPWAPLLSSPQVLNSKKILHVCCTRDISHGTLWEDNLCTLSKSVCLLNEETPSASSSFNHFGLNPAEMSKSCGEPHSSGPLCIWGPGRLQVCGKVHFSWTYLLISFSFNSLSQHKGQQKIRHNDCICCIVYMLWYNFDFVLSNIRHATLQFESKATYSIALILVSGFWY